MSDALLAVLAVCVLFNLVITRSLFKDNGLTGLQRFYQLLIIWFVPVVGSCIVLGIQGQHHTRAEMKSMVPFPFYFAGYVDHPTGPFELSGHDGADISDTSIGEGSCGGD